MLTFKTIIKLLPVFGATGDQGGSAFRAVLGDPILSKEFTLHGITRDNSKPAAKDLASKAVEIKMGSLTAPSTSLIDLKVGPGLELTPLDRPVIYGLGRHCHYWLSYCLPRYFPDWLNLTASRGLADGKIVTDAAITANIQHLI